MSMKTSYTLIGRGYVRLGVSSNEGGTIHENLCFFFFQAEDGIRDVAVTGVQTCALPISELRRLVDELVHRERDEVEDLDLDDRSEPGDRRADAGADERRLRDRRVAHTVLAESLAEPAGHAEDAADQTDAPAHDEDTLFALHLAVERLVAGLRHRGIAPAAP